VRLHPLDGLLYLAVRTIKSLDRRDTELKAFNPGGIRNILVVSTTAIGDTLLSTPAINAVRRRYPHARIIAHFNVKNMELFENNQDIDGIIPYYGGYRRFFRTILEMRRFGFDLVLILHGNEPQTTPMAYLSGARFIFKTPVPEKNGFLLSNRGEGDRHKDRHAIDARLRTVSYADCREFSRAMVLKVEREDINHLEDFLKGTGMLDGRIIIGFQPGAANPYKMWPSERFIDLGRRLVSAAPDVRIIITGSRSEGKLCGYIADKIGKEAVSVAGKVSLKLLGALVSRLDLLVTNDTGTMHMAVVLKTKTVSLFCPTDPLGVGPVQDRHLHRIIHKRRPCSPCITKRCREPFCMNRIEVKEVFEAVTESIYENSTL